MRTGRIAQSFPECSAFGAGKQGTERRNWYTGVQGTKELRCLFLAENQILCKLLNLRDLARSVAVEHGGWRMSLLFVIERLARFDR